MTGSSVIDSQLYYILVTTAVTAANSMSWLQYRHQNLYPEFAVLYLKHEGVHFFSQFLICQHYAIM